MAAVEQLIQPQQPKQSDDSYRDSHSSGSASLINTVTGSVGPTISSVSPPRNQLSGGSDNPGGGSASPPYKHLSNIWNVYRPAPQPDQYANNNDSDGSDIDSEVSVILLKLHFHISLGSVDVSNVFFVNLGDHKTFSTVEL